MNAYIPDNPRAIVLVDKYGRFLGVTNNIHGDLCVMVVQDEVFFNRLSLGLPFKFRPEVTEKETFRTFD